METQLSSEARRAPVFFFQTPTRCPASVRPIKSAGVPRKTSPRQHVVCDGVPQTLEVHLRGFQGIFGTETKAAAVRVLQKHTVGPVTATKVTGLENTEQTGAGHCSTYVSKN